MQAKQEFSLDKSTNLSQKITYGENGLVINEMPKELVRDAISKEPWSVKFKMLLMAVIIAATSFTIGVIYATRASNVSNIQSSYRKSCETSKTCQDGLFYDWNYMNGPFTDEVLSKQYIISIQEDCDLECQSNGNRFSVVYTLGTIIMFLFFAQTILGIIGVFNLESRVIGFCTQCACVCFNLVVIIMTGVIRFRLQGKLSALSKTGSLYNDS